MSQAIAAPQVPPTPSRWVTDNVGFLSAETRNQLDQRLSGFEKSTGHQLLVWIGATTNGAGAEDFAVRAFQAWRVGRKGIDDGLVLFIWTQERKTRIEVGYGLEARVPDAAASRLIREVLAPKLRQGDNNGAVTQTVEALIELIKDPADRPANRTVETAHPKGKRSLWQLVIIVVLGIGFLLLFITNPSLALWLLFSLLSGGRGGGRGGGGGFSGGGGRSGGGGASGSW